MSAAVVGVFVGTSRGERKTPVASAQLRVNHGIEGDAHAGEWLRQVSLLAVESIRRMQVMGLNVVSGDFAENHSTEGIELCTLPIGTRLAIGEALLEVTQISKKCHTRCAIFYRAGDCVMPREGGFAREGGFRPGHASPASGRWRSRESMRQLEGDTPLQLWIWHPLHLCSLLTKGY